MLSILIVIFGICRNYIKCNYLKDLKHFVHFYLHYLNLHQILKILENIDDSHSLCFSEITDCERDGWTYV